MAFSKSRSKISKSPGHGHTLVLLAETKTTGENAFAGLEDSYELGSKANKSGQFHQNHVLAYLPVCSSSGDCAVIQPHANMKKSLDRADYKEIEDLKLFGKEIFSPLIRRYLSTRQAISDPILSFRLGLWWLALGIRMLSEDVVAILL